MTIFDKPLPLFQKIGLNITRNYYYSPIPNINELNDNIWSNKSKLLGINIDDTSMFDFLSIFLKYKGEYDNFQEYTNLPNTYFLKNMMFGVLDAEVYYSMIRHFKPKRIIEIGSGYSTLVAAEALQKNEALDDAKCELISIEPYPNKTLKNGFPGLSQLIISKVEDVDISLFNKLGKNDMLFIDSSHVLRTGNDVQYIFLEILPRLDKGVIIHFHDIFLPMEYPKSWVIDKHFFWTEQYLLQTFLMFNTEFEVLWASNYMKINYHNELKDTFNSYKKFNKTNYAVSSFWIQRNP